MFVAKNYGKKAILVVKDPIPTPWPVNFADCDIAYQVFLHCLCFFSKGLEGTKISQYQGDEDIVV